MKRTIIISVLVFFLVATLALAPGDEQVKQDNEPRACCMAMTADCLACAEGITIEKYCAENSDMIGCEDILKPIANVIATKKEDIQAIKEQLREQYGNDTEALRLAYQEQARQIITNYQGDMQQLANEYRARNAEELQGFIDARKELARQEFEAKKEAVKKQARERLEQENQVRIAVHSLLAMEDLTGGIGNQVSEIARAFDNRVEKITELKEEAEQTKGLRAVIAGGNQETAQQLREEATAYKERIQELKQLREQANMSEETKVLFDEQVAIMVQEQARLEELAEKENNRGLLGWLWKKKISTDAVVVE